MHDAMMKVLSSYSEDELRLLLRFANDGYKGVLEATQNLKGLIDASEGQPVKKRGRPRR